MISNLKRIIFPLIMCVSLLISGLPISSYTVNAADTEINYTIWDADAGYLSETAGESVKAEMVSSAELYPKYDVIKMTDDGNYYRTDMHLSGYGGGLYNTVLSTGKKNTTRGYGWLEDETVLGILRPFITIDVEYRAIETSGKNIPADAIILISNANAYKGRIVKLCSVSIGNAEEWTTYSEKLTGNHLGNWYSGFLGISIYSESGALDGTYRIDLRKFEITLSAKDELAINDALKAKGSLWKFDDIVQSDPDFNSHNSIWNASPERLGAKDGDKVTAWVRDEYIPPKYDTYIVDDAEGPYYHTEMTLDGVQGGDRYNAVFQSGINYETQGYGWLKDINVLNALRPYMYITFEYRFTGTNSLPADAWLNFGAATPYGKVCNMGAIKGEASKWKDYTLKVVDNDFTKHWYAGYFCISIWSSKNFTGKQYIDIRNIRIEFRDCDRPAINEALASVSGIKRIENFTLNQILERDESRNYNYYNILVNNLPFTYGDANDDAKFNIIDLIRTKKYVADAKWISNVTIKRLDCNGDDIITSVDLISLRKELLACVDNPYENDLLTVSVEVEHPGVPEMDAYYILMVKDKNDDVVLADNVTVSINNSKVTVNGYAITVPYSVRNSDDTLTVTVTSKTNKSVFGRYDFEFIKNSDLPTLEDNFNSLNTGLWSDHYNNGGFNVEDGKLILTAQVGQQIGITTKENFEQAYGSYSARIKMPEKANANGAFWLYSNSGKTYRRNPLNPSISGGEIDIVEYFPTWKNGSIWSTTVHWYGPTPNHIRSSGVDNLDSGVDLGNDYHIYSAVWTKEAIYSYLDGKLYRLYNGEGISDHSDGMQIIFSLRGNNGVDSWGGAFNANDYPDSIKVDWLKVYSLVK